MNTLQMVLLATQIAPKKIKEFEVVLPTRSKKVKGTEEPTKE